MTNGNGDVSRPNRWQRREKRKKSERERIPKHGASLQRVYINAVHKRLKDKRGGSK
jgi:hypothetical protein